MANISRKGKKDLPIQELLEGEYFRVYRLHKNLNSLSIIPHRHDHYELMMVTSGEGYHSIDFKSYQMIPSRVFFLHPGQVHLINDFERDGWLILFGEELFKRFLSIHRNEDDYGLLDSYSQYPYIDLTKDLQSSFTFIVEQVKKQVAEPKLDADVLLHYVSLLLLQANRAHAAQHPIQLATLKQKALLHQLKKILEQSFKEQHQAAFYAKELTTDIKYLNKVCRQATGLTVYQLIQERLLTESKILLQTSALSVKEISYQLGFNDPAFFGRFFKKYTQITPLNFRQSRSQ
jgi:AraC family transcriptional activator of pobA